MTQLNQRWISEDIKINIAIVSTSSYVCFSIGLNHDQAPHLSPANFQSLTSLKNQFKILYSLALQKGVLQDVFYKDAWD
jgi:hypothetical protein